VHTAAQITVLSPPPLPSPPSQGKNTNEKHTVWGVAAPPPLLLDADAVAWSASSSDHISTR
jgi:hypothetical protein